MKKFLRCSKSLMSLENVEKSKQIKHPYPQISILIVVYGNKIKCILLFVPWEDTTLERTRSILLPTRMTGLPRRSCSCSRDRSSSARWNDDLSITEYIMTNACGKGSFSSSCNDKKRPLMWIYECDSCYFFYVPDSRGHKSSSECGFSR